MQGGSVQTHFDGNLLVLHALGSQKNNAGPLLQPHLDSLAPRQDAKLPVRLRIQLDRLGNSHHPPPGRVGVCRGIKFYNLTRTTLVQSAP